MDEASLKRQIRESALEITRLHARIHETVLLRDKNDWCRQEWSQACREFRERYDALAFPGGYSTAFERMAVGDEEAVEAAICFLGLRPYFFRSGYMFKDILRKVRRAAQTRDQAARLAEVERRLAEWKSARVARQHGA